MNLATVMLIGFIVVMIVALARSGSAKPAVMSARDAEMAERRWQAVRAVAEEDVTALGQQIAEAPVPASLDPEAARDFEDALGSYERAKDAMSASTHPDDLQWVSKSLDDGRFALARLDARRTGRQLPTRRPPCFFDQRHGLSVGDASWAPPGGALREVPACAACEARLADGQDPLARMVPTAEGDRPYYDAGPEYAPWARGWYAGSGMYMMNNVLMGTLLFNALYLPPGHDYFAADAGGDMGGDFGEGAGDAGGGDFGDGGGGFDGGGFDFGGF
jgi:uncharacterized membrane protein YgcG